MFNERETSNELTHMADPLGRPRLPLVPQVPRLPPRGPPRRRPPARVHRHRPRHPPLARRRPRPAVGKAGADDDPADPLLNPARLLVARNATNALTADAFACWLVGERGQAVVGNFTSKTSGERMYSRAPRP
ncbi:hypothetical protein OCS_01738 [Ophiocordyceps sinensis CO18]|uniref:Uncharacterized protein n=1 Tax=Ophiocordyceps sinensis (strain Co18 / CGMCC 3.14243) TaxID=911162 RepID=T5ALA6_OPHSC|nr:hypothetical protein OCS_01738 [Ophiocordyceps sinensis CO18]